MACNHSDKRTWIGKADGVYCSVCGNKIDLSVKPVKKAPAKKTTTGRAKK